MCIFLVVLANRLTVAVSDVLNPNIDDMSRGVGPLGYGTSQGDFSPQVSLHMHVTATNCYSGFWQKKRPRNICSLRAGSHFKSHARVAKRSDPAGRSLVKRCQEFLVSRLRHSILRSRLRHAFSVLQREPARRLKHLLITTPIVSLT